MPLAMDPEEGMRAHGGKPQEKVGAGSQRLLYIVIQSPPYHS